MKKTLILISYCSLLVPGIIYAQNFKPNSVVPASLAKYKFGMALDLFKLENKNAVTAATGTGDFRIESTDAKAGPDFKQVTFYFDAENNKPLYEMIIEYHDESKLKAYCNSKLKTPNDEDGKWRWTTKEGYVFKAWTFGKKLVFALALPNTEWDETKTN